MTVPRHPTLSALLLAILAGATLPRFREPVAALLLLAVAAYWALDLSAGTGHRYIGSLRLALACFVVLGSVILETGSEILLRRAEGPATHVHDGAIQTEEAMRFLLAGQNPYVKSYTATPMAEWKLWPGDNPALEHLPYLPGAFVLPLPLRSLSTALAGYFDIRLWQTLLFGVALLLLPQLSSSRERGLTSLIAFGLNPALLPFAVEGRNDVVVLSWLVGALFAWQRRKAVTAGLLFAVACGTKQTAWLLVPFFVLLAWKHPHTRRAGLAAAATLALLLAPFFLWDPAAFVDDTLIFQSTIYPIKGWGLSRLLLAAGMIPGDRAAVPFGPWQALIAIPALGWLLRRQWQANTLSNALLHGAFLSVLVFLLGRAFQDNYLGYLSELLVLAWTTGAGEDPAAEPAGATIAGEVRR